MVPPDQLDGLQPITLTDEQEDVVRARNSHLQIDAGAGSGKTLLIVEKLAYELGYVPLDGEHVESPLNLDQVGAITFTRKAAGELKERLRARIRKLARETSGRERERWVERSFSVDEAHIGTIDAFAGDLIRDYGALAGMEAGFEILDPGDSATIREEVAEEVIRTAVEQGSEGAQFLVRQYGYDRTSSIVQDTLDQADTLIWILHRSEQFTDWARFRFDPNHADIVLASRTEPVLALLERAYERYKERLDEEGVLDHTHVLLRACELAKQPELQAAYRADKRLIFIDEHQDTSHLQMVLLFRLAGLPGFTGLDEDAPVPNLTLSDGRPSLRLVAVGDPKQGIYGFRGADIEMWKTTRRVIDEADGRYMELSRNFRTRPSLARFHDSFLGPVMGTDESEMAPYEIPYRSLESDRPEHNEHAVEVHLSEIGGSEHVAEVVADRVAEMLENPEEYPVWERQDDGTEVPRPVQPRDIAVLSRALKRSARHYEWAFRKRGIPCHTWGGSGLWTRPEVQELVQVLRAVADPHNPFALTAFLRSPLGGLDDVSLAELSAVSSAAPHRGEQIGSLYDALCRAEEFVGREEGQQRAQQAIELLEELRDYRDRVPHDRLLEIAIDRSGYRAYLAGAPDTPAGIRNLEKLIRIARRSGREPLIHFVDRIAARVQRADYEEEAPLYQPEHSNVVSIMTIHRAKGLEFPVVVLAELDQSLFWKTKGSRPYLDRRYGVVMPLDVSVTSGNPMEGTGATLGEPNRWQTYFEEATWREYAEARRLMYVAATRARDRLLLAGSPKRQRDGVIRRPRSLEDNSVEWLHTCTAMTWLQYLFTEQLTAPDHEEPVPYGSEGDEAPLRYVPDDPELSDEAEEGAEEAEERREGWPRILQTQMAGEDIDAEWSPEVERRLASLEGRVYERESFTPTELMTYDRCAQRHLLRYRHGISRPEIEVRTDDPVVRQIPPEIRGKILHHFFQRFDESWDEMEMRSQMEDIFLRAYPMATGTAEKNANHLVKQARNFINSDLFERLQQGSEERRELPFFYQLNNSTHVSGVIDWMVREEDGRWVIVDLKAGLFPGQATVTQQNADQRAVRYRAQSALYTLAATSALEEIGQEGVKEFLFFFTDPALSVSQDVTPEWLIDEKGRLEEIVARIRRREYGQEFCPPERSCRACEYVRFSAA